MPSSIAISENDPGETSWPMPEEIPLVVDLAHAVKNIIAEGHVQIPVFPILATRILKIMNAQDPDVVHLARAIMLEPAVASQMLRVANSVVYARGQRTDSIRKAVIRLGSADAGRLAMQSATRELFVTGDAQKDARFHTELAELWHHAVVCSFTTSAIVVLVDHARRDQAFVCGLLHDVGQGVVLRCLDEASMRTGITLTQRLAQFVVDHAHTSEGRVIAQAQELPHYVARTCEHHHDGRLKATADNTVIHAVRIASGLDDLRRGHRIRAQLPEEIYASQQALGLDNDQMEYLGEVVMETASKASNMIGKS